jgi:hypothetical protein
MQTIATNTGPLSGAKSTKWCLIRATFSAYKWQFLSGIPPRLIYTGFSFAQPFLINRVIEFVGEPPSAESKSAAAGLAGATALIYVGAAVRVYLLFWKSATDIVQLSNSWYHHMAFQLMTMFRGGLSSLIYKRTLELDSSAIKESAPITLMSTDIDGIAMSVIHLHDLWGSLIEIPLGCYILQQQVGPPCFLLLIPAISERCCSNTPTKGRN